MIQVALCPAEIRRVSALDLSGVTAVVFDVLRATSCMITGLAHGVDAILPVQTIEDAKACKANDSSLLLAGERGGLPIEGFDLGNSPDEFESLSGRQVVMTTTNGTVAIQSVKNASSVLIGALLNVDALADFLARSRPKDLLLVCAGTVNDFSLEDAIGAGALVARLSADASDEGLRRDLDETSTSSVESLSRVAQSSRLAKSEGGLSDSAILVRSLYQRAGDSLEEWLRQSKNGRALQKIGKRGDIRRCAQLSVYDVVGTLHGNAIIRLEARNSPLSRFKDWR